MHNCLCAGKFCEEALDRLWSLIFRVCFWVRMGEPLQCGAISPDVTRRTFHRYGISNVGPDGSGPCDLGSSVLWWSFRSKMCTRIPRCSLWDECGFHGYVLACCEVSPMSLDVHVLWRHNCRLSVCCDAPLLGERTSYHVNWVGVAFVKCRRWCHCHLYFCLLPCLTRTMYGFETYSELKQASRMGVCEEVPTPVR